MIVVCGVEGVQPQTELLFEALKAQGLPVLFFVNKMDREGADAARVCGQLRRRLSRRAALCDDREGLVEALCDADDALMERWLEDGDLPGDAIRSSLGRLAQGGEVFPVLTGSALRGRGIEALLDGILAFLPPPDVSEGALCGVASHMLTTAQELRDCIGGRGALCDALVEQFCAYSDDHFAWGKEIWDIAAIGYMIDPDWVPSKLIHSPLVTEDHRWSQDGTRHFIREAYFCRRNPIFRDLFRKLTGFKEE